MNPLQRLLRENCDTTSTRYNILIQTEIEEIQRLFEIKRCAEFVVKNPVLDALKEAIVAEKAAV
ncbi:hypothetical protein LCGC14_1361260 [marine sediment metagenome]|uniref:Uncharacterized protein n=1 Tax=marine sediment metagenome TaxID=412755 RepID=A0A0F9KU58_9ZZZZ